MTKTNTPRSRGRPKLYDAEQALAAASTVFWKRGYSDTSLDDLAAAMGMNRPSIYRAFGDKSAIYEQALEAFGRHMQRGYEQTVDTEDDLRIGLQKFFRAAIDVYTTNEESLGCMMMCTAPASALTQPEVQTQLGKVIASLDARLRKRFKRAITDNQLSQATDPNLLAQLAQAVLHSLALRARAGNTKSSLQKFADGATRTLIGEIGS